MYDPFSCNKSSIIKLSGPDARSSYVYIPMPTFQSGPISNSALKLKEETRFKLLYQDQLLKIEIVNEPCNRPRNFFWLR